MAAGISVLRGVKLPTELFDPDGERRTLQRMVEAGPLVDGVAGRPEATVDGLTWEDYSQVLTEIRGVLEA